MKIKYAGMLLAALVPSYFVLTPGKPGIPGDLRDAVSDGAYSGLAGSGSGTAAQEPPAPGRAAAHTGKTANYYLEANSYDPLLMRRRSSAEANKLNIIGGTIDIPGIANDLEFARQYRQAAYQRHDIQSDVALAVYVKNLPKMLVNVLFGIIVDHGNPAGGTYTGINGVVLDPPAALPTEAEIMGLDVPQEEKERLLVQLRNAKMQIEGRENPFRKDEMLKMMKQIIVEEAAGGIQPKYGEPHEWSPEFTRYCRENVEMLPLNLTKLLTALSAGVTSRHFKTGMEVSLINYILSREKASVTIDQLFRASYRLNGGDVYLTILSIENILSDNWRHPRRDQLAVTRKLANISNFYNGKGDKYGAWYHFHGIMLYGYVYGGFRAALISGTESVGSHVLSGDSEPQEDHINSVGGEIGARLAEIVNEKEYLGFLPDRNYCDPDVYLDLGEDFRDRLEYVESKDFEVSLDNDRLWLKPVSRDYRDCRVEIIYNDHTGKLNSRYIVRKDHVDLKKGKSTPLFIDSINELLTARVFITGCLAGEQTVTNKSSGGAPFPARGVWVEAE